MNSVLRRAVAAALAIFAVLTLCGCEGLKALNSESGRDPEIAMLQSEKQGLWVAYFGRELSGEDSRTAYAYVRAAAAELQSDGSIERYFFFNCENDAAEQRAQMERAAGSGCDVFLIDPCGLSALEYAGELVGSGRIKVAFELSDEFSCEGVYGMSCSTAGSDMAAADHICAAADPKKQRCAIMLTSEGTFGESKRFAFASVLADYPQIELVADERYSSAEEAEQRLLEAFEALGEREEPFSGETGELLIFCDRLTVELIGLIAENAPAPPLLTATDRLDAVGLAAGLLGAGELKSFAAVNSPEDLPAIALKTAVRAAAGDELRPSALENGEIKIEIVYTVTDGSLSPGSTVFGIADDTYIATGILQDVVSALFK